MTDAEQQKVREWSDLIIDNYGAGWRVVGVLEAARAHQELPPNFWEAVLARVMNKSGEKAKAA